jgi:pimeloyl-ACP methyl ester carboxylesterase
MAESIIDVGPEGSVRLVTIGDGEDVVLIHGAFALGHDWSKEALHLLARDWRVTVLDRPGHGRSRRPRFRGDPRHQARQIREALFAARVERPILVGHSLGALVTLAYAELFPEDLSALVLVAPLGFPEPRPLEHGVFAPRALPLVGPMISSVAAATTDPFLLRQLQKLMFDPDPVPPEWESDFPFDQVLASDHAFFARSGGGCHCYRPACAHPHRHRRPYRR